MFCEIFPHSFPSSIIFVQRQTGTEIIFSDLETVTNNISADESSKRAGTEVFCRTNKTLKVLNFKYVAFSERGQRRRKTFYEWTSMDVGKQFGVVSFPPICWSRWDWKNVTNSTFLPIRSALIYGRIKVYLEPSYKKFLERLRNIY